MEFFTLIRWFQFQFRMTDHILSEAPSSSLLGSWVDEQGQGSSDVPSGFVSQMNTVRFTETD